MKKKLFALLLSFAMLINMVPPFGTIAAAAEDMSCEHHPVHTAECGYVEAVEASDCAHTCDWDCYVKTPTCTHTGHDETCGYVPAVAEIPEVPCTHTHDGSCGYVPAVQAQDEAPCGHVHDDSCVEICGHAHDGSCGYAPAVAAVEGADCTHVHDEFCGYVPAVPGTAEIPCGHEHTENCYIVETVCGHQHDEYCGYDEENGLPCIHICDSTCQVPLIACTHTEHDTVCGYAEANEGSPCSFTCEECILCEICGELNGHLDGCENDPNWEPVPYFPTVNFTNAAPLMEFQNLRSRSRMTRAGEETDTPVELDKYVTWNEDGTYTLTLESYATGKTVTTQTYKEKPADIVLVLDYSNSMAYCSDPNCGNALDKNDFNLIYGSRLNGTSNDMFVIHNHVYTNDISKENGKYRVNVSDVTSNGNYYVYYKNSSNLKVYAKAIYCDQCTQEKNDGQLYWHVSDHLPEHDRPFHAGTVQSSTVNSGGNPLFVQFDDLDEVKCVTRYRMMYEALDAFVRDLVTRAKGPDGVGGTEDDVDHKVGIVRFATVGKLTLSMTPVLGDNGELSDSIARALQDYSFGNGTATDEGLELGVAELKKCDISGDRSRLVVLLTDGVPTGTSAGVAGRVGPSLKHTYDAINTYQASVYTVGIFQGADASQTAAVHNYKANAFDSALSTQEDIDVVNSFMNLLSSNYPNISTVNQWSTRDSTALTLNPNLAAGQSYYLSASDIDSLKDAFLNIAGGIGSETTASSLDSKTVVRDVVTRYFDVPQNSTITAYTMTYGKDADNNDTWTKDDDSVSTLAVTEGAVSSGNLEISMQVNSDETTTVDVTNFDFGEHYVGLDEFNDGGNITYTPHGKKLVIEIKIRPKDEFLGGNQVPTNTYDSGIYVPDPETSVLEKMEGFDVPRTDVTLATENISFAGAYQLLGTMVLQDITVKDFDDIVEITVGSFKLNLLDDDWGLTWQDDYAELNVTLLDENGKELPNGVEDLRKDTVFKVRVTISPTLEGTQKASADSEQGSIYVFYPEFIFTDTTCWYGDTMPSDSALQGSAVTPNAWKHPEDGRYVDEISGLTRLGALTEIPEITFTCTPAVTDIMPKTDVPVNVDVTHIGYIQAETGMNLNEYCFFKWQPCADEKAAVIDDHAGDADSPEFYIHSQTGQLTVAKIGGEIGEPYAFTVYKDGTAYTELTITGNESVTIYELPIGTYRIQEDGNWSWRYGTPAYSAAVTLSGADNSQSGTITCTNTLEEKTWLNGFSDVVANIFGVLSDKDDDRKE